VGEVRNAYINLVGKCDRRRSLGRPRRSGEDNIEMDIKEISSEVADWNKWFRILNLRVSLKAGKFLTT
jgi:hypothetical protein